MDDYIPFLKLKSSEILAVKELDFDLRRKITPFFDFPKKDNLTAADFQKKTRKMVNSIKRH